MKQNGVSFGEEFRFAILPRKFFNHLRLVASFATTTSSMLRPLLEYVLSSNNQFMVMAVGARLSIPPRINHTDFGCRELDNLLGKRAAGGSIAGRPAQSATFPNPTPMNFDVSIFICCQKKKNARIIHCTEYLYDRCTSKKTQFETSFFRRKDCCCGCFQNEIWRTEILEW